MMKIIHLSDLHIGYSGCENRFRVIIDNIISFCENTHDYIIIITGDIVDDGTKKKQLDKALAQIGILEDAGFIVLVVPGNHDYGFLGSFPLNKFGKQFNKFFYGVSDIDYPILGHPKSPGLINDIAFIGINSMEAEVEERDYILGAQGRIGNEQLAELDELLKTDTVMNCRKRVVYLHHHPFKQRLHLKLHDVPEFKRVLMTNGNIDCLLFGHYHKGLKWNNSWGIKRCYDAGTTTSKGNKPGHHRIIDLSKETVFDFDGDFHPNKIAD